ncbi:hypothetical protein COEREDRAFT_9350 [Coemansia reversa NRRL 1564]|uniref:RING-type domain-containing protein n=1 Tax=Coemansia reversa (strain ATCC 12441 / NRRL 1564) TaxID=763665 RepID=A0A2G5B8R9_COERN|nr:hypothetical protein COEREDRAFT_9350 [Coemansia reversa NRRL 1564]|eukprot:PIA15409.1 hypothetical protein COEREDRAFT_9350 [Coemansia reversa NRRL 1564]
MSDSDSDGFFSDIKAFRRELGLSSAPSGSDKNSTTVTTSTAKVKEENVSATPASQNKRKAATPGGSGSRTHKRQGIADTSPKVTKQKGTIPGSGVVSPGEIAALLSPRGPRYRRRLEQAGGDTETVKIDTNDIATDSRPRKHSPIHKTPGRSSSTTPQQSKLNARSPPAFAVPSGSRIQSNTVTGRHSSRSNKNFDLSKSPPDTPSATASLTMRSLWGVESSPISTPPRRFQPTSPLESSRLSIGMPKINSGSVGSHAYSGIDSTQNGLLGEVEDAIVTDEDMEQARRKLGQEQTFTQQQIIREIRERIVEFVGSIDNEYLVEPWRNSVTLLGQFHTCGYGKLSYTRIGLVWKGDMLGPIATVVETMGYGEGKVDIRMESSTTTLVFPWTRISSVRRKSVDENSLLMATIDEDLGIAFQMKPLDEDANKIDILVANMNEYLQKDLAERHAQSQNSLRSINPPSNVLGVDSSNPRQMVHSTNAISLIQMILSSAKKHSERFDDLDISKALEARGFVEKADTLISEFSQQLAKEAQIAINKDAIEIDRPYKSPKNLETGRLPKTCTLCYTDDESVELVPCYHRLCRSCFMRLEDMYVSSSQQNKDDPSVTCICPWDRCYISSWSDI